MSTPAPEILRLTAFTDTPAGGNPAGVVLDATALTDVQMQQIASDVGYSETAFITNPTNNTVRYFSPVSEVPFCGHATIATAVALAERDGPGDLLLATEAGPIAVTTQQTGDGPITATLTLVSPAVEAAEDVDEALAALRWSFEDLDPDLPPRLAYAGARHLVLAARTRERLADLDYDFEALKAYMSPRDLVTVALVHRDTGDPALFHARNPFPVGGVVEDPATGAAAAAFGAYLRALGLVDPPATITIHQGDDLGRPSRLSVAIGPGLASGIRVSGGAVRLPDGQGGTT
jgi:PhzF family phenazine biosynthesis protein